MILTGVSMLVVALDQFTKFWVAGSLKLDQSIPVWPNYFYFTYTQNRGTAFAFMSDMASDIRIPFFIVFIVAAAFMFYSYQRVLHEDNLMSQIALGLVWGGALGNLIDRLIYGKVIDFLDVRFEDSRLFIFNLADSIVTLGVIYLFFEFVINRRQKKIA